MNNFKQNNIESLTKLIKKNISIKANKDEQNNIGEFEERKIGVFNSKNKQDALTPEERLKKVKEDGKNKLKEQDDLQDIKKLIFFTAFKVTYFIAVSAVFAFGVIQFGGAFIEAFQSVLYKAASGILKK